MISGPVTYPGYEYLTMTAWVERIEPERLFSFRWHPAAIDPKVDYSKEATTTVEFRLEDAPEGTLLTVTESGFQSLPAARRARPTSRTAGAGRSSCGTSSGMSPSIRHRAAEPSALFAALGDRTRLALVRRLATEGALSVTALTEGTRISRQAVTKHLDVLARAGLVQSERQGRERLWVLAPGQIAEARRALEQISRQWDQALDRLRTLVER